MSKQLPMIPEMVMSKSKPCLGCPPLWLVLVLCLTAGVCFGDHAQAQQMQMPTLTPSPMQRPGVGSSRQIPQMKLPGADGPGRVFQERRIKALNTERQKKLVSDTNKLLKLTNQLNAEIGNEQASAFTPEELRMLARIEKLAKSVKNKMSTPIQLPSFRDSFSPAIAPAGMP